MNAAPKINIIDVVEQNPGAMFTDPALTVADLVTALRKKANAAPEDMSAEKNRKAIKSAAYAIAQVKTSIDSAGKKLNEGKRAEINRVDAIRKTAREELDDLRDEIRKPVDDWEKQELARIDAHKAVIQLAETAAYVSAEDTAATIRERINWLEKLDVTETALQEFAPIAAATVQAGLNALKPALERAEVSEAQARELEELRKKQAERDEQERQEREAREMAEADAQAAREAAEREKAAAEQARKEAEEKAEREKAAIIAEQERKEQERADAERREQEEANRRARNLEHRRKVNKAAMTAIMEAAGIGEDRAKKIITAIASGSVPNVAISY